jgi:predicted ATPase
MTYWHMQLHPHDIKWCKEKELLENKLVIGIDDTETNKSQVEQFKQVNIGDIVLIKRGKQPIALVEVVGNTEYKHNINNKKLDWFDYKRKIKLLEYNEKNDINLPAVRLSKSVNQKSETYQYIDNWYNKIIQKEYKQNNLIENEYKIQSIFIKNNKMLKDFNLDLLGNDKQPLPVIIIAGKNGTGKTTLLEYLFNFDFTKDDYIEIFKTQKAKAMNFIFNEGDIFVDTIRIFDGMKGIQEAKKDYMNRIEYLPVQHTKLTDVENEIVERYITRAEELDSFKKSLKELQDKLKSVLSSLDLTFNISKVNYNKNKVFFKNLKEEEFGIDSLSTGEKTLVSKVLYLYFKNIKNKIILIDEPELSLHPSWQNKVLKVYEKFAIDNNCQIIIATHSPHIIASAKNEYIRALRVDNETNQVRVLNNLYAEGRDINSVLFDVMGEVEYRPREFEDKIDKLYHFIDQQDFNKAKELLNDLESSYGKDDSVIIEAKMTINMLSHQE